jgi:flagellar motor switch/type III secretory pathway protein FliN
MLNFNRYIINGNVARYRIVGDIANQKISHDDLLQLLSDARIKDSFIGTDFTQKAPKSQWSADYLQRLTYKSMEQAFNEDYLLYVEEVSHAVKRKRNSLLDMLPDIPWRIVIAVASIAMVLFLFRGFMGFAAFLLRKIKGV